MTAFSPIRKSALSYLDWKVVEMARDDGPRSFNPEGFAARLARLVGLRVPLALANDRLETLRRFSVRAWYWDLIRAADLRAVLGAGYSRAHVLEILAHIAAFRGFAPTVQEEAI